MPSISVLFQWEGSWGRHWRQEEEKEAKKEEEIWCHRSSSGPPCQGMNLCISVLMGYKPNLKGETVQLRCKLLKSQFRYRMVKDCLDRIDFCLLLSCLMYICVYFPNRWIRCQLISYRRSKRPLNCSLLAKVQPKPWRRPLGGVTSSGTHSLCPN